jgi:hypothetical protein
MNRKASGPRVVRSYRSATDRALTHGTTYIGPTGVEAEATTYGAVDGELNRLGWIGLQVGVIEDRQVSAGRGDLDAEHVADAAQVAAGGADLVEDPVVA